MSCDKLGKQKKGHKSSASCCDCFVGACLNKREKRVAHPQEGARHAPACSARVVPVVKATLLYYFTSIQSVPSAPANDVNDVSNPKTADDHVRR